MAYSTKNCMVDAKEAERIKKNEKFRKIRVEQIKREYDKMKERLCKKDRGS